MSEQTAALDEGAEPVDASEADADEAAASEAESQDAEQVDADDAGDQDDTSDQEPEVDEFDFGGNKLQLPKGSVPDELRDEINKFTKGTWGDYTRKSQEIAERSKGLEAREKAVETLAVLNGETLNIYSKGLAIKGELEQLRQVDLSALWQSDPDQARRISDHISHKQAELNNIVTEVGRKEQELVQAQQSEIARRMDEGRQIMERRVTGFEQKAPEVVDYVVQNYGLPRAEAEKWPLTPATAEMAYKAMMYDRMQAKVKQPAPKPAVTAPVKPIKTAGKATRPLDLVRDADKMSAEEWARRRNADLAKRR